ncbi:MAG: 16S rRNA (cytidine(1402)-2'-O)-methyltransferase [Anaerolineae bacterium CG_4_9_14_3_um_filter_57_17]|nr:16S rRNA (cytidine(1402)-2'-O)-methyltransferase [bacterium]NCT21244.1 16S rRNA (cytidine(1402)-2'-O)-methyltransferase [bacterium]OIO86460.1 MAG: 16S rRNA (cytidine(1402)-2'-O)-methyltransferase [Anaerolineae bacterium CG2_30_57_67]PJB64441.1 MAG: 16S rRNA (cytidine(1402)-2'-O)-methyltransferase [Anaerolineae bacterium CG_4_9_14_3_um_filter_57_17]
MGILYLVATPIGNLEDFSPRAIRVLREARLIAAEDTRQSQKLLNYFEIHTPLTSYFEHNKFSKIETILAALQEGDVALVSDAGTPAINDPGYELACAAIAAGHTVSPIPGPSAPIAALSVSGLPTDAFLYLGYLPRKSAERKNALRQVENLPYTLVFLETPHRLLDALRDLRETLGERPLAAAREITKIHEEIVRGETSELLAHFSATAPRGEFVLIVGGKPISAPTRWSDAQVREFLQATPNIGRKARELSAEVAEISGWNKRDIYALLNEIR